MAWAWMGRLEGSGLRSHVGEKGVAGSGGRPFLQGGCEVWADWRIDLSTFVGREKGAYSKRPGKDEERGDSCPNEGRGLMGRGGVQGTGQGRASLKEWICKRVGAGGRSSWGLLSYSWGGHHCVTVPSQTVRWDVSPQHGCHFWNCTNSCVSWGHGAWVLLLLHWGVPRIKPREMSWVWKHMAFTFSFPHFSPETPCCQCAGRWPRLPTSRLQRGRGVWRGPIPQLSGQLGTGVATWFAGLFGFKSDSVWGNIFRVRCSFLKKKSILENWNNSWKGITIQGFFPFALLFPP